MKKVLILVNHDLVIYNFRKELVERLLSQEYSVYICSPYGQKIDFFVQLGAKFINIKIDRRGKNPFVDLKLLLHYFCIMHKLKPDIVLTYTIKPNLFGGVASRFFKIPYIVNITGLGSGFTNKSILQSILIKGYKIALKNASKIYVQNKFIEHFFIENSINSENTELIPGSGVNIDEFSLLPYPKSDTIQFVFISRIMKEKGIEHYLEAAKYFYEIKANVQFHVCGFVETDYHSKIHKFHDMSIINYHGFLNDVRPILSQTHCTILPSYYPEGISNVLLESACSGRPIITTDNIGCKEVVDDNITGFIVKQKSTKDLVDKIQKFISLPFDIRLEMGLKAREKVINNFNRTKIVDSYLHSINEFIK